MQQEDNTAEAVAAGLIGFTAGIALGAAIDNDYYYGPYGWHGGGYMYNDAWDDYYDAREDARDDWQDNREDMLDERGDRREDIADERGDRASPPSNSAPNVSRTRSSSGPSGRPAPRRRRSASSGGRMPARRHPGPAAPAARAMSPADTTAATSPRAERSGRKLGRVLRLLER